MKNLSFTGKPFFKSNYIWILENILEIHLS